MSEVVGFVALSHSPFWDQSSEVSGPGAFFVAGVNRARRAVSELSADLVVICGPDHFRNFFLDTMPAFCMNVGAITSFGDYGTYAGQIHSAPELAGRLLQGMYDRDFDPAFSLRMGVDHGITQPYEVLVPNMDVPAVAAMINCAAAPRPSFARSWAFGTALGEVIRNLPGNLRVLILASGGLSHWVATPRAEEANEEMREFLIDGRNTVREYNAMREQSVAQRAASGAEGRVNPEWDRWFLDCLERRDLPAIFSIDPRQMEEAAGNGAHEVRCWLAGMAAWGGAVETLAYEPTPAWSTGMGIIAGRGPVDV